MKFLLVLATVVVAALAVPNLRYVKQEWDSFKSTHVKIYDDSAEEAKRFAIFHKNLIEIEEHNKLYKRGLSTYKLGITQFADLTTEEFLAYVNGTVPAFGGSFVEIVPSPDVNQSSVDWRTKGVITPVKNQKHCGSCWAFAVTGALEGQYALKSNKLVSLSEQNLIDCSTDFGNKGCKGGSMVHAYQYVGNFGIETEDDYPYKAVDGVCRYNGNSVLHIHQYGQIKQGPDFVQQACTQYGPLAVAIHATSNLHHYAGGILTDNTCGGRLNHAVLLVGYGDGYYLVKNSWGDKWGEAGYFRLSTSTDCGLPSHATFPIVD